MSNFFKYFSKLVFSKTNNAKIIPFNYFFTHFFSHIIISVTLKSNFTKEGIYKYISYMIIHVYENLCLYIFIHTNV